MSTKSTEKSILSKLSRRILTPWKKPVQPKRLSIGTERHDLCVVYTYSMHSGWILDAIADHVLKYASAHSSVASCRAESIEIPSAERYFFIHPALYFDLARHIPSLKQKMSLVFYTHAQSLSLSNSERCLLNNCRGIVSMSSLTTEFLVANGIDRNIIFTEILGCDDIFRVPTENASRSGVCLSSRFCDRKNPKLLVDVVKASKSTSFFLAGKKWTEWKGFRDLVRQPNFEYCDIPHYEYPEWYRRFKIFLSTSSLEGGPMPLLETMNSGCIPVVSDTGFARDVLGVELKKLIFPVDASCFEVCNKLEMAAESKCDVRTISGQYTWDRFCSRLNDIFLNKSHR